MPQIPQAATRTRASRGPGGVAGTSSSRTSLGPWTRIVSPARPPPRPATHSPAHGSAVCRAGGGTASGGQARRRARSGATALPQTGEPVGLRRAASGAARELERCDLGLYLAFKENPKRAHSWISAYCEITGLNWPHGENGSGRAGEPSGSDRGIAARRRERPGGRAALGLAPVPLAHRRRGGCPDRRCRGSDAVVDIRFDAGDGAHGDDGHRERHHRHHPADRGQLGNARAGQPGQSELRRLGHRDRCQRQGRPDRGRRAGAGHSRHDRPVGGGGRGPGPTDRSRGPTGERRGLWRLDQLDRFGRSVGDIGGVLACPRRRPTSTTRH